MPLDPQFGIFQCLRRLLAITRQQVESQLRIKNFLRLTFKREQADRLLLQLVNSPGAALASRLEHVREGTTYLVGGVQPPQDERNRDGRAIRHHVYGVAGDGVSLRLDHWV